MLVQELWLKDWRGYTEAHVPLVPGLTAVVGDNAAGKTSLLEAVGWLTTLSSFRGAPADALVRTGATSAVIRAQGERDGRALLLEAEVVGGGRDRVRVNRQPLRRARDLLGALRATVFSPDDLELVKGGPGNRRGYIDAALVAVDHRQDDLISRVDKALRQRNALLRQCGGRLGDSESATLDVWDERFGTAGDELAAERSRLVDRLAPELAKAYAQIAGGAGEGLRAPASGGVSITYAPAWSTDFGGQGLVRVLALGRAEDLRRGVTTIGPHRDEIELTVDGRPARTHASQGEQRSLAAALRLASHAVVTESAGSPPVLLLDDVLSELDPHRCAGLLEHLPEGQALFTTAGLLPAHPEPAQVLRIVGGTVRMEWPG